MGFQTFNIYFDVAALFIFAIVIVFHFQRKNLPLMQNRMYLDFLVVAFIATICDVFNTYVRIGSFAGIAFSIPVKIFWITQLLGWISTNLLPVTYALYCLSLVDYLDNCNKKQRFFMVCLTHTPAAICIIYILLSPIFIHVLGIEAGSKIAGFYINDKCEYIRGGGYPYILINTAYYAVYALIILLKYGKSVSKKNKVTVLAYIVIMMIAVGIQIVEPKLIVQCFGISLAAIMFSSIIQTPEEFIDRTTDLFNEAAFIKMTSNYCRNKENFLCVCAIIDDTLFISNNFGINNMNNIFKQVSTELIRLKPEFDGHPEIYYVSQGKFILLFKNYHKRKISQNVFLVRSIFTKNWETESIKLKLYSRLCVIESPDDVHKSEDILDVIDLVTSDPRYKKQNCVYAHDIDIEYKKRTAELARLVRSSLVENTFDVYYQPIYSIKEERMMGAEALIRMKDQNGNFVSPEEFIPIAEKTGDILNLGNFVFESVCKTLSSISPELYGIKKVDINLSVAQCMQEQLSQTLLGKQTEYNVPVSLINLEITETAAAHTPDILLRNMRELAEAGIELSLDDYGSGYSNMNYLLSLPFKMVKIDKNIVWTAFSNSKANIALAATIAMIKKLGMTVLAEGVETKEQMDWLISLGCDYLQGFYFAKGLPKNEYLALMKKEMERVSGEKSITNKYLMELDNINSDEETLEEL